MSSIITRRNFLRGLVAAPAIVAASSLMPVRLVDWNAAFVIDDPRFVFVTETIRDLLMPGLFTIRGSYDMIPRQWDSIFKENVIW